MTPEDSSKDNIQELLFYLNNVKLMDKLRFLQVDVVIIVIWALLLIIASLSETFLNISFNGSNFTILIWIITLIFGGIITIFLKEQIYLTFRPKFKFINKLFISIVITGIAIAILFDYLIKLNQVIFPLYSILFAIYSYSLLNPYYTSHADIFTKNKQLYLPIFSLFSGFVNITGAFIENVYPDFMRSLLGNNMIDSFESLIFTLCVSSMMIYLAWYNHNDINNYISKIEIED